ncbi:rhodanese-like domain-containing protein [Ramlibacter sp. PS3R-8]|uniref:rhodanese-like domain-containing protein n=1 Tax=Ramlibacter sp. PS3R-8 TaxID=3133437 RepID=UPI0030AA6F66
MQDSEPFAAAAEDLAGAHIVDVRRKAAFDLADSVIPGAQWRDPEQVNDWCAQVPKGAPVVVYCVHGHEVGRSTAMALRAAGIDARFLRGGIEGWKAAGRPLAAKPR